MLTPRPLQIVLAVLISAFWSAAAGMAEPRPAKVSPPATGVDAMADIVFYLARGEADACGRGCNEWIAAEGKIDAGAASRLRRLLAKLGRRRPPIYLQSPGGSVAGGLELGRLIRDQKLTVSVGHTVPSGCDRDKPLERSCEALKRSGQELESEFDPAHAQCNSSCVYALAGGTVRFVPPWVKLGIHDVALDPDKKPPPGGLAEVLKLAHARIQEYLRDMGIDKGLYTAAAAIPHTSLRPLERDEVVRFGMDRREFGETVWRFVDKPRPEMSKGFFFRNDGEQVRYLDAVVNLVCGVGPAVGLVLTRQHVAGEPATVAARPVSISLNGRRIDLPNQIPSREFDTRWASLSAGTFEAIGDATIGISGLGPDRSDGSAGNLTLNTDGLSAAYAKLRKSCDEHNAIAAVAPTAPLALPSTAPWANPTTSPFVLGQKTPWGQNPPAGQGLAVLPNTLAAPTPPGEKSVQSAPEAAGSPTQAEPTRQDCAPQIADAPQHLTGRVTSFIPAEQASARTNAVEANLGMKINPAYLFLKRVEVERFPESNTTMAAVPENLDVKIGDVVEINSRYRDPSLPCHFIPWTIGRLVGRAG